jgi:hypothetical protein
MPEQPATTFTGSAQRIWRRAAVTAQDPWRAWRRTMGAMALTPLAWILVAARYAVVGLPLLAARRLRRGRAR